MDIYTSPPSYLVMGRDEMQELNMCIGLEGDLLSHNYENRS